MMMLCRQYMGGGRGRRRGRMGKNMRKRYIVVHIYPLNVLIHHYFLSIYIHIHIIGELIHVLIHDYTFSPYIHMYKQVSMIEFQKIGILFYPLHIWTFCGHWWPSLYLWSQLEVSYRRKKKLQSIFPFVYDQLIDKPQFSPRYFMLCNCYWYHQKGILIWSLIS